MSSSNNNNTSMIPVLDRSNYGAWSKVMRAFLRAQGLWQFVNGMIECPDVLDPKKSTEDELKINKNALNDWDKHDNMAIGHMTLRLSTSIQEEVSALNTSAGIWERLEERYGKATPTTVYKDFKEALSVRLHANQNPSPAMDKMAACFQCLTSAEVDVLEQIKAMMLLAALPQKWEMLVSIVTQQRNLDNIKFIDVRDAVLAQFQSETMRSNHGQRNKGQNQGQQANKLSAVKCKRDNPNFSNQQQGEGQHQQQQNQQNSDKPKHQRSQHSYAWIVCLCTKDAALGALKQFLAMIKNQHSTTVKEWMSDAGGEYKSEAFLKTLKDAGIKILQSAPHTPQQNGQAERFMRTLMDKAEAMCHETCLPQSWWEFAVQHATHVYNRTPLRRLEWQTPYQLLNGEVPDISHL
jgi:hypothetical protein